MALAAGKSAGVDSLLLALILIVRHLRRMAMFKLFSGLAALVCGFHALSTPAHACSVVLEKLTNQQIAQQAQEAFRQASLIIDAEVIEPMALGSEWQPGLIPAASLRVIAILKGKAENEFITVVYGSSCDIALFRKGERLRVLLLGEGIFQAEQILNGVAMPELKVFNAEIDRLAGRARPSEFSSFPGEEVTTPE